MLRRWSTLLLLGLATTPGTASRSWPRAISSVSWRTVTVVASAAASRQSDSRTAAELLAACDGNVETLATLLSKDDLRALCSARALRISGTKAELAPRLLDALSEELADVTAQKLRDTSLTESLKVPTGENLPARVFISNVHWDATEDDLLQAATRSFQGVVKVQLAISASSGSKQRHRGFGSVAFVDRACAMAALRVGSLQLGSRTARIKELRPRPERQTIRSTGPSPPRRPGGRAGSTSGMLPSRGALLHRMRASKTATELSVAVELLLPLTTCQECTMVVSAWAAAGQYLPVLSILADATAAGIQVDTRLYSAAIGAMASCGQADQAVRLLAEMHELGVRPNVVTYSAAISACNKAGGRGGLALELMEQMRSRGVVPNVITYNTLISALGGSGMVDEAVSQLGEMTTRDALKPDVISINAAISACEKGGQAARAGGLLEEMPARGLQPTVVSYNGVISAWAAEGEWEEAQRVLTSMASSGTPPNLVSLNAALYAAANGGEWRPALALLAAMPTKYGVQPDVVSFGSTMLAVSAAGELDEGFLLLGRAANTLGAVSLKETYVLHMTLLTACRDAGDLGRAETVQTLMHSRNLVALAPVAAATIGGVKLEYENGRTPADSALATRLLVEAVTRSTSYSTQYHALPFDFIQKSSPKQQQSSLQHHAEKKALSALLEGGVASTDLRISVNIKMCADCHTFMKGASEMLGRKICVHEPGLVHSFENGMCTCDDMWRWEERSRKNRRSA